MASGNMDRSRHAFPAFDLLGTVDSGGRDVTLALLGDLSRFRNNEPGAGALCIVEGVQLGWHIARAGATARQRCHDDAVPEPERAHFDRAEEAGGGISIAF